MSKSTYQVINPYSQKIEVEFSWDHQEAVNHKIQKLDYLSIQSTPVYKRSESLRKLASIIQDKSNEFATTITQEMGKTLPESTAEVSRAVTTLLSTASELESFHGEVKKTDQYIAHSPAKYAMISNAPYGRVLAITPFNFPLNLAIHKIAPAYAMGNAILLKPHPQCYMSSCLLMDSCREAGLDENIIAMTLPNQHVLDHLSSDKRIDVVSFTGGLATANLIAAKAGIKKQIYELGGNDALVVFNDANIDLAVSTAIVSRFGVAGQRCNSAKRIFLQKDIAHRFQELFIEKASAIELGNPMSVTNQAATSLTHIGPLATRGYADLVESQLCDLIKQGAKVELGGSRHENFISPTIITGLDVDSKTVHDEIFGPIAPLFTFTTLDQLSQMVNSSELGLQFGAYTHDLNNMKYLFEHIECATVNINEGPSFRCDHLPFGGMKKSGLGREGAPYSFYEYSQTKTLVF